MPVPSMTLNADGTVNKVAWTYQAINGAAVPNPQMFLKHMIWSLEGDVGVNLYFSEVPVAGSEHVLTDQSIPWSAVHWGVSFMYDDFYGNQLSIGYSIAP
jgi:hypothetical protein